MKHLLAVGLSLITVAWTAPWCAAAAELEYLGSFTFARSTESDHIYISEFRLWRDGSSVRGVYLDVAGLYGDHKAAVYPIERGLLGASGHIELQAGDYHFTGTKREGVLRGELRRREQPLWGGVAGSNEMILRAGRSIESVPEAACPTRQALEQWIATLVARQSR